MISMLPVLSPLVVVAMVVVCRLVCVLVTRVVVLDTLDFDRSVDVTVFTSVVGNVFDVLDFDVFDFDVFDSVSLVEVAVVAWVFLLRASCARALAWSAAAFAF